jgi:mitochondrial import receptor subunit TOM40
MQGGVDHEGSLNGRFNYGWSDSDTTKIQANVRSHLGNAWMKAMLMLFVLTTDPTFSNST